MQHIKKGLIKIAWWYWETRTPEG